MSQSCWAKKSKILWLLILILATWPALAQNATPLEHLISGAMEQVGVTTIYDPAYVKLPYPQGDLPVDRGVCADVIVRAFRKSGLDLQSALHHDMKRNFGKYPNRWGLKAPDSNIDHRRVPNLMTYFTRMGKALPITQQAQDYQAGDVVAFRLSNGLLHIGLVVDRNTTDGARPLLIHNIGAGAQLEDILFAFEIIGHYRYY